MYLLWDLSSVAQVCLVADQPHDSRPRDVMFLQLLQPQLDSVKRFLEKTTYLFLRWLTPNVKGDICIFIFVGNGFCSSYPFADVVDQQCSVGSPVVKWGHAVVLFLPCRVPYLKAKGHVPQMDHVGHVSTWAEQRRSGLNWQFKSARTHESHHLFPLETPVREYQNLVSLPLTRIPPCCCCHGYKDVLSFSETLRQFLRQL